MASKRTVTTDQLTPKTTFYISGEVNFARINSLIQGKELEEKNKQRQMNNRPPIDKPYVTLTLINPVAHMADPNHPTLAEIYANESFYPERDMNKKETGRMRYEVVSKGTILPAVYQRLDGNKATLIEEPEGELATGLNVTLVMNVYKGNPHNGIGLQAVIVNEPIRYYQGSIERAFKDLGLVLEQPDSATDDSASQISVTPTPQSPETNPIPQMPFSQDTTPQQTYTNPAPPNQINGIRYNNN